MQLDCGVWNQTLYYHWGVPVPSLQLSCPHKVGKVTLWGVIWQQHTLACHTLFTLFFLPQPFKKLSQFKGLLDFPCGQQHAMPASKELSAERYGCLFFKCKVTWALGISCGEQGKSLQRVSRGQVSSRTLHVSRPQRVRNWVKLASCA